jgi:hypothetical protein
VQETATVASRAKDLLAQIERDVLDDSKSLASALRRCLVLGGRAGSADLRTWAAQELHGYGDSDELPDYRRAAAPLLVDGFSGNFAVSHVQISATDLPDWMQEVIKEEYEFWGGIGSIEALIRQADSVSGFLRIPLPGQTDAVRIMNGQGTSPLASVSAIYWELSAAALRSLTDRVRTMLAELVAELRAGLPDDEHTPSAGLTTHAFQVAVQGNKNRVSLITAQARSGGSAVAGSQENSPVERSFWTASRRICAAVVGVATIAGAVAAILALHPKL